MPDSCPRRARTRWSTRVMRTSATLRLLVMTALALGLLVPLAWVFEIVSERASRRDAASADIAATWGGAQYVTGPVLALPYNVIRTESTGRAESTTFRAVFLPQDLQIDGSLRADKRSRGIFDVIVYHVQLRLAGRFAPLVTGDLRADAVDWDRATLNVGVTDPRGLTQRTGVTWNGQTVPMTGGVSDVGLFAAGVHADLPSLARQSAMAIPFELTLELNGTRELRFIPDAQPTDVTLAAT